MPICASTVSPHNCRPGNSRCPGLRRKNVTVRAARGAIPRTSPLAPSTPLGTSTATTGTLGSSAAMTSRAVPSTGRASPAPKIASITRPAPSKTAAASGSTGPFQRPAAIAASPRSAALRRAARPAPASRARPTAAPQQSRRRRCCPAHTGSPAVGATSAATRHRRRRGRHFPSARCRAPRRQSSAGRPPHFDRRKQRMSPPRIARVFG